MKFFDRLNSLVSDVKPLIYVIIYTFLIPIGGLCYATLAPHGFYAPYAKLEPSSLANADRLASVLSEILRKSVSEANLESNFGKTWKLDLKSVTADDVIAVDETHVRFRVRITADGTNEYVGFKQLGWSALFTIPERPVSEKILGSEYFLINRVPVISPSDYASIFNSETEKIVRLLFKPTQHSLDLITPTLTMTYEEDKLFRSYVLNARGDPDDGFWNRFFRLSYLSAVVITTLGLGDIVPITPLARLLVGTEAILGIIIAGLFLNALAYQASKKQEVKTGCSSSE